MSTVEDRLTQLREQRMAREKARIEKLREMNLKKYSSESQNTTNTSNANKSIRNINHVKNNKNVTNNVRNYFHTNLTKTGSRPSCVPTASLNTKESTTVKNQKLTNIPHKISNHVTNNNKKQETNPKIMNYSKKPDLIPRVGENATTNVTKDNKNASKISLQRKSLMPTYNTSKNTVGTAIPSKKSIAPPKTQESKPNNRESVFDRLYKPKVVVQKPVDDVLKLKTDPNFLRKVAKDAGIILNKRHTVFGAKPLVELPVRRSISAVHLKRIDKSEIKNCIHKWSSIGEKLDKVHLKDINEDEAVKEDAVVSAIKSERKRVKFRTPVPTNLNTPRPEELQNRLKSWLQKRGKSLDSYHHLQCFGLHHLPQNDVRPIETDKFELYDDENKENIAVENDSDNESYTENMNDCSAEDVNKNKWRRASYGSDSVDFNDTPNSTVCSSDIVPNVDELVIGALNDLTGLLREGFDWEQGARWLRAVRERFPHSTGWAPYWECRAALEEARGDLPASLQCWEEAVATGAQRSVAESNLDLLLDKFMQLKISPESSKRKPVNSKLVDVKNVFKSTIIRFAVQQAKLRNSLGPGITLTVTPVRRSGRLSVLGTSSCRALRRVGEPALAFVPNPSLRNTP